MTDSTRSSDTYAVSSACSDSSQSSNLLALGFGPFFQQQWHEAGLGIPARISAEHRGSYEVWSGAGQGTAKLTGKLRHHLVEGQLPAVGDWVLLDRAPTPDEPASIDRVLARRTTFSRGCAGRQTREQVVAANVDRVFIVCGSDADFNPNRIERYLARVWASGADPAVILNKADLCADAAELDARLHEVERHCPGVPVHATSVVPSAGEPIGAIVRSAVAIGQTAAFVGSSGAGKSTLINTVLGEERLATSATRESDGRGKHTTTHRQLIRLPDGGLLLDTPGMRELQIVDEEGLDAVFDDIQALAPRCRFADCSHAHEPGCAVKEAVEAGALDRERLDHYHKLQREARAYERRHDARLRRQGERVWGQLHAEVARLRRWKEGG